MIRVAKVAAIAAGVFFFGLSAWAIFEGAKFAVARVVERRFL